MKIQCVMIPPQGLSFESSHIATEHGSMSFTEVFFACRKNNIKIHIEKKKTNLTKQAAQLKRPIKECQRTCMYVCTTAQFYVLQ